MAEGVKDEVFGRPVLSFIRPRVAFPIELFEGNEGAIARANNPLSSGKSVRWYLIMNLVKTKAISVTHVESG